MCNSFEDVSNSLEIILAMHFKISEIHLNISVIQLLIAFSFKNICNFFQNTHISFENICKTFPDISFLSLENIRSTFENIGK